jgi:hypothetical protein
MEKFVTRTPPANVIEQLREEVDFGCPICRSPLLTFHHFDPTWAVENHHRPAGMIALCKPHHDTADRGDFSRGELLAWKTSTAARGPVKTQYPFSKRAFLTRLGGNYVGNSVMPFRFEGRTVIKLGRAQDGLLSLTLDLRAENGEPIVQIAENTFTAYPENLHSLTVNTSANHIRLWLGERNIGLDLKFSRITEAELSAMLSADRTHAGYMGNDVAGNAVKDWANTKCLDDENKIPLFDFKRLKLVGSNRSVEVNDGIYVPGSQLSYNAALDSGTAFEL